MDMEFLDLQIDEMDKVEKGYQKYDFSAVSFHRNTKNYVASFNRHAAKMLTGYVCAKIYANSEYIVFAFSDKKECNSYKIHRNKAGGNFISCASLERFKLHGKTYKLYNTQKGLAIKINDPIEKKVSEQRC